VRASHILIALKPGASPQDTLEGYTKIMEIKKRAQAGEDFETAAYSGKVGEIVGPVRTRFGYHILKIMDKKPARGEVEVSHIMLRVNAERDNQKTRTQAFEIYDQLKGGIPWVDLCKQYSEDTNSKNNGGKLRPFGVGAMASVPEFERVAFSLQNPGEISDPFQTAYGWHIVKLDKKIPLPPFEELASSLKTRVMRDERVQISRQALMIKLKREFLFAENEAVKTKIFALADTTLTKGNWKINTWPSTETLFTISTRSVPVKEFVDYVKLNQRSSAQLPARYMAQLYEAFTEAIINLAFEENLIRSNPEYEMMVKEYYEGILLFDIMEKEVWNKASEDSVGQRRYFESHSSNYQAGERAVTVIYSSNAMENMKSLKTLLEKGDTTGMSSLIQSKKIRKETGRFQKTDRPVFSMIDWKPGQYSAENNGMYYLARILEILPPGPMSFEEARSALISDYQDFLEKSWIADLRKKYPVKINEKGKKYVLQKLVQ
jgi:peptidyl-prolyl cis-trans isomerase SurA